MWYFQSFADEDRKFVILPGKDYVLGRRDCDIVIENDPSVSRKHAILKVSHPEANVANVSKPASITLKDISKFGTFVNNQKVKGEKVLESGDEVRFGTPKSMHRVVYEPFVVTTSCVNGPGKNDVRLLLSQIGGHVSNDWRRDCSFLVMKTLTVTIKVVCALVSQKPIITVDYLHDLLKYLRGEIGEKPNPEKYLPPVTERLVHSEVSFHPTSERSGVFLGMSFHFLSQKQFQKMSMAVELGGGVPILSDDPKAADLEAFLEDNTVVMNPASGEVTDKAQREWIEEVKAFLLKNGRHMVQDAEVGYAVLYHSTSDYCNPSKDVSHLLSLPLQSQTLAQTGTQVSQVASISGQPPVRKPGQAIPPVGGSRNPAATSKNVSSSRMEPLGSEDREKRGTGGGSAFRVKNEGVFTVPESASLMEEAPGSKAKGAVRAAGRRSRSRSPVPLPVESIKEEPDMSSSSSTIPSESGNAMAGKRKETVTENVSTQGEQMRSQSRSPVHEHTAVEALSLGRRQTRSRSPMGSHQKRLTETFSSTRHHSRSSAGSSLVPDTEASPAVSQPAKGQKPAVVKIEEGAAAAHNPASTPASAVLFDSEMTTASEIKKEDEDIVTAKSKPVSLLDEEDEDVIQPRRPAPSRNKRRRHDMSSEEEEDPFDFVKKRPRKSPSPKPARERLGTRSPSPAPETCPRSPSPASEQQRTKVWRSASPNPGSRGKGRPVSGGSGDADESAMQAPNPAGPAASAKTKPSSQTPGPSPRPQNGHTDSECGSSSGRPVPYGFLTTRLPIQDQVGASTNFERENIEAPAVLVQFENLVARPTGASRQQGQEDQSDVPEGMVRWKGKLVRNFKKFTKVKHMGADRLPTIIGGRDLEEYCGTSRKVMDDWLKELQEAESQQTQREREAQELFDWQPPARRGKGKPRW